MFRTSLILFLLPTLCMICPVYLYNQHFIQANEIDNIVGYDMLPTEVKT